MTTTGKEMGLIKHLSARNRQLNWAAESKAKFATTALDMIHSLGGDVFEYATRIELWAEVKSFTRIGDYTNKNGIVSQAHFNPNGKYLGSTKKLGNEPKTCYCPRPVTKDTHTYNTSTCEFDSL